jgi:cell division protein FtsI/penicillin-binding protein 2
MIPLVGLFPLFHLSLAAAEVSRVNYVAVDVRTRTVIEQEWPDADAAIPVGSLVKPFTALAYAGTFPEFVCKGKANGCWLAHGHGRVGFRDAMAQSCNAYFLNLARGVDAETLRVVAAKFGIAAPGRDAAETRIGLGNGWQISPIALAGAFAELASRSGEARVNEILQGMDEASRWGTASAIGRGVFAKTGTAPGTGARRYASDGFTVVMAPAESPRMVLLVRVRGVTGAEAAKSAARILREMKARP